ASAVPHRLTISSSKTHFEAIFELSGDQLKVAHFGRSHAARPSSFTDQNDEFGTLIVKSLQRTATHRFRPSNFGPDQSENERVEKTYALRYAKARDTAKLLTAMQLHGVRVVADVRTNRLSVSSDKNRLGEVEQVISELDRATPSAEFVVLPLRNIDSKAAAQVVRATFVDGEDSPVSVWAADTTLIVRGANKKTITQIRNLLTSLEWLEESRETSSKRKRGLR
ncbi:MAG: secretin N-terminal domain-containing protein, partial [Planctomycetota bacterium]